jgi:hypothetical protein
MKSSSNDGNKEEKLKLLDRSSSDVSKKDFVDEEDDEDVKDTDSTLLITFLLMLVFSLGNRIFGKLTTVSNILC